MPKKKKDSEKAAPVPGAAFLYFTSFITGFAVLTLEIVGFRIFAPYFGYSVYVSGSLISLVLIALSVGYYLGGKLADVSPNINTLFKWLLASTGYLIIITLSYESILGYFSQYSPIWGTLMATMVIFAIPMIILSMTTPYIVKTLVKQDNIEQVGSIVGKLFSVSTFGSIAGSLVTTFIFIPEFGSKTSFIIADVLLLTLTLYFLARANKTFLVATTFALPLFLQDSGPKEKEERLIYEKESIYNLIKVYKEKNGSYSLSLNKHDNIQSNYNPDREFTGFYYDHILATPLLTGGGDVLILGMGGGTNANQMHKTFGGNVKIEAVDIDPVVVSAAKEFFKVKEINPELRIHVDDARNFIQKTESTYDIIIIDLYHGGLYVPYYTNSLEFFTNAKEKLNPGGLLVINTLMDQVEDPLFKSVGNTLSKSFDSLYTITDKKFLQYNGIFLAFRDETSLKLIKERLTNNSKIMKSPSPRLIQFVSSRIQKYEVDPNYKILTDDHAPIAKLTFETLRNWPD